MHSLYSDAQIVINISGLIEDSQMPVNGVKQGCPLSPTLFGVLLDALKGWLSHRAAAAGVSMECKSGGSRLLSSLIYANDLALIAQPPSHLQALIDPLSDFCASAGYEISATKSPKPSRCSSSAWFAIAPCLSAFFLFWLRHSFLNIFRQHLPLQISRRHLL